MGIKRWLGLPLATLALGCAPNTRFRNAAVVPAMTPPMTSGRPLEHSARVDAYGGFMANLTNPFPVREETPALRVAQASAGLGARVRLGSIADVGLRVEGGPYSSTEPSAVGTPPVPGHKSVFGVGLSFAGHYEHPSGFGLGAVYEGTGYQVPWAQWECVQQTSPCPGRLNTAIGDDLPGYMLADEGTETVTVHQLALIPSFRHGIATGFMGMSVRGTIENVGFSDSATNGNLPSSGSPAALFTLGVELAFERAHVLLEAHRASGNPGNSTWGFGASFGFELGERVRPRGAQPPDYYPLPPPGSPMAPPPVYLPPPQPPQPLAPPETTPVPSDPYAPGATP